MKKFVFGIWLFSRFCLFGQQTTELPDFTFGFCASAEFQTLNIQPQPEQPGIPDIAPQNLTSGGGGLGLWGQWELLPMFHIRPAVQFSYLANSIRFETPDGQFRQDQYTFADLELPLHFTLTNQFQRLPINATVLFGGRLSWNLAAGSSTTPLKLLPERLGLDLGVGAGFYWGKWKIQPEFIYSYSLNNIHDFQNSPYDWAVGRVLRDRMSLRLVFGFGG